MSRTYWRLKPGKDHNEYEAISRASREDCERGICRLQEGLSRKLDDLFKEYHEEVELPEREGGA